MDEQNLEIPAFDEPHLIFCEFALDAVAYDPFNKTTWDVASNKSLKERKSYYKIQSTTDDGKPRCSRILTREEALQLAEGNEDLDKTIHYFKSVSQKNHDLWVPSIDHPRLEFVEVEDRPLAHFINDFHLWRVHYPGTLKSYNGYPYYSNIAHNGQSITKEEALVFAEYWYASKYDKNITICFDNGKTFLKHF